MSESVSPLPGTQPVAIDAFRLFHSDNMPAWPISTRSSWALFLDVDGTLIEHMPRPEMVTVSPELARQIRQLSRQLSGALALISGRSITMLDELFECADTLNLVGLHGAEWRLAGRTRQSIAVAPEVVAAVRQKMRHLAESCPGTRLEDKGLTLALHWRQVPHEAKALKAAVEEIGALTGYVLQPGKFVYELKPPGVDKGQALGTLLHNAPFLGRKPIYIGDDQTDEPAIAAAQKLGGIGIAVGSIQRGAHYLLADAIAVRQWLKVLEKKWA